MNKISLGQLKEFHIDTIRRCGTYLRDESDSTIEYEIFEEFDIGVVSFLHEDSLNRLYKAKMISKKLLEKSVELRQGVMDLQDSDEWNLSSFKTSPKWESLLRLADECHELISTFKIK